MAVADALCAVCLSDVAAAERATLIDCAHAFCRDCIAAWARRGGRACPLCRAEFSGWRYGNDGVFLLPTAEDAQALRAAAEADARAFARQPPPAPRVEAPARHAAQPTAYFQRLRRSVLSTAAPAAAWGAPPAVSPADAAAASLARRAAVYASRSRAVPPARRRGAPAQQRSRAELRAWLERDLRALLRTDDVALLCHFALSLYLHAQTAEPPGSGDAAAIAQLAPYVGEAAAELLWHELRCFGGSHLNMAAYDAAVRYEEVQPTPPQQEHASEPAPQSRGEREPPRPRADRQRDRRRRRHRSGSAEDDDDGGRWAMEGAEHAAPPPRMQRTRR
jgi:hypothetical protein